MASVFKKFPPTRGYLKLLVYGDPGTQKTRRALRMPSPVYIIDMENGSTDYSDLVAGKEAYIICTSSHIEAQKAIREVCSLPKGRVGTLVIDPISMIWASLQQGHIEKMCRKKRCQPEDVFFDVGTWGKLKRNYKDIMAKLMSAKCHVIMTARGKDVTDPNGVKQGYSGEFEKSTPFLANVVIESRRDGDLIIKDRTGTKKTGERMPMVEFTEFLPDSAHGRTLMPASEAAQIDAVEKLPAEHHPSFNDNERKKFCASLGELKLKYDDVAKWCEANKRPRPSGMTTGQRIKLMAFLKTNPKAVSA
tara:strand:- start:11592 stop:12506 length:915 start_codon:yes stop_codon:yes gene_type:complete